MAGWIKIYRDLQDHWLAQDMEKLGWWVDLLLSATHKDTKLLIGGQLIELKKGQLRASATYLAERWGKAKRTIQKFLDLLESDQMISRESSHKITIITICNYESYQEVEQQQVADEVADEYPIGSQSVAENKNAEEDKEIYNTNSARTHEERVSWDASRERGFCETFKARGAFLPMGTATGKSGKEILALLDVYMANREVRDMGHKDYNEFVNLFKWHIENGKIKVHDQPQQKKSKNILEMYG
jgi:hypothetical protein